MTANTDETTSYSARPSKNASQVADHASQDSEDLEALFDSIVAANRETGAQVQGASEDVRWSANAVTAPVFSERPSDVINQIGLMTRTLHDALRELGLNKKIEKAASSIPDARDRLNYVAILTQQAAERVLSATEAAQPLVEKMEVEAHHLSGQWQMLFEKQLDIEQFKDLVMQTHKFLHEIPKQTKATHAYLMEIMMAQDFQDLTGQVIKKIIDVTENMEQQLLALLVENAPASVRADLSAATLNGPVVNTDGRKDIVSNRNRLMTCLKV